MGLHLDLGLDLDPHLDLHLELDSDPHLDLHLRLNLEHASFAKDGGGMSDPPLPGHPAAAPAGAQSAVMPQGARPPPTLPRAA